MLKTIDKIYIKRKIMDKIAINGHQFQNILHLEQPEFRITCYQTIFLNIRTHTLSNGRELLIVVDITWIKRLLSIKNLSWISLYLVLYKWICLITGQVLELRSGLLWQHKMFDFFQTKESRKFSFPIYFWLKYW